MSRSFDFILLKPILKHPFVALCCAFAVCGTITTASAQTRTLRIVTYNIDCDTGTTTPVPGLITPSASNNTTMGGVLEGIGEEVLVGNAQPIDVVALQETTSNPVTVQPIVDGLNAFYTAQNSSARYAMSTYQGRESGNSPTVGNGPNAMVYNTNTLQLVASTPVDPPAGQSLGSTSGEYREVVRYEFAPAGVTAAASNEFYVYVSHYKSGTTASDLVSRGEEAVIIRNNETNLPSNARVLYVGDYNVTASGEASYQTMLATNSPGGIAQGQGVDPLNVSAATNIDWGVSTTSKPILASETESANNLRFRDDFEVMTTNIFNGTPGGLIYVPGTYHTFGNNGTIAYHGTVTNTSNTALNSDLAPGSTIRATDIYQDLSTATDHLPIVADYTIPIPPPPVASFNANNQTNNVPFSVTFTDASSGSITNRFWNFGDGSSTNVTSATVSHTYTVPGIYDVTEIVTGPFGAGTNAQKGFITALPPAPVAAFNATPTNGAAPLSVTFNDTSTGQITNRFWDFGDDTTTNTTLTTFIHVYASAGVYDVQLIVSGPGGSNTFSVISAITVTNVVVSAPYQFNAPVVTSDGSFTLSWPTDAGRTYRLDVSTDLQNWTPVITNTATGTNLTFTTNTTGAAEFFRVARAP